VRDTEVVAVLVTIFAIKMESPCKSVDEEVDEEVSIYDDVGIEVGEFVSIEYIVFGKLLVVWVSILAIGMEMDISSDESKSIENPLSK
jgi:hypothetical protein